MDIFAIYQGATVMVQGWEGTQVLISFDGGGEKYVGFQEIDILD